MTFDVFLSHNSKDKLAVLQLGEALKRRGLSVLLDEWELLPGRPWQETLENIITTCKSAAVCIGRNGIGPWEQAEMEAAFRRFIDKKKEGKIVPVIPVLLPSAPTDVKLPLFLQRSTWVDLRDGLKQHSLDRLQWSITGRKRGDITSSHVESLSPVTSDLSALAIWQEKLDHFQRQEAITSDPAQKFSLKKQIEEAE